MTYCRTCELQIPDDEEICRNCWEIENRLEHYLKSDNGKQFVIKMMNKSCGLFRFVYVTTASDLEI